MPNPPTPSPTGGTITIPAPIVRVGERCDVLNYYCRPPVRESGEVGHATYELHDDGSGAWSYDVFLDRRDRFGFYMWRYVRDDGIAPEGTHV